MPECCLFRLIKRRLYHPREVLVRVNSAIQGQSPSRVFESGVKFTVGALKVNKLYI